MKFSASNVDFSGLGPNLLHLMRPVHAGVKGGYPLESGDFCAVCFSNVKMFADRHKRVTDYNKHWRRAF